MKVLIVGGRSSLAQALKPRLAAIAEVMTAGRRGCDLALDLSDPSGTPELPAGIDVVVNTASHFGGNSAEAMKACVAVNVQGALTLAEACQRAGVRHFVQISSIHALLPATSPFFSSYAATKRQADELLGLLCAALQLELTVLRPSQFYGGGDATRRHQPFLTTLIDKAERGENIELYGSRDAQRNFIHLTDVASVIAQVIEQRLTGSYACQFPENVGYSGIVNAAIRAFGSSSQLSFRPDKPDTPDNTLPIDLSLFERLGHWPSIDMAEGMRLEAERRRAPQ